MMKRSRHFCSAVSTPLPVAPIPRARWLPRFSVSRSRLAPPQRRGHSPVAVDGAVSFYAAVLEQMGERLQHAVS